MADVISIRGFVASEVKSGTTTQGTLAASFRMGSTDRHFDRNKGEWVDGETNWYTVQTYRQLAGNITGSLKKGQRVVVVGRLRLRQWETNGKIYHLAQVDAESVGHDLMWGTANYQRTSVQGGTAQQATITTEDGESVNIDTGELTTPEGGQSADIPAVTVQEGEDDALASEAEEEEDRAAA